MKPRVEVHTLQPLSEPKPLNPNLSYLHPYPNPLGASASASHEAPYGVWEEPRCGHINEMHHGIPQAACCALQRAGWFSRRYATCYTPHNTPLTLLKSKPNNPNLSHLHFYLNPLGASASASRETPYGVWEEPRCGHIEIHVSTPPKYTLCLLTGWLYSRATCYTTPNTTIAQPTQTPLKPIHPQPMQSLTPDKKYAHLVQTHVTGPGRKELPAPQQETTPLTTTRLMCVQCECKERTRDESRETPSDNREIEIGREEEMSETQQRIEQSMSEKVAPMQEENCQCAPFTCIWGNLVPSERSRCVTVPSQKQPFQYAPTANVCCSPVPLDHPQYVSSSCQKPSRPLRRMRRQWRRPSGLGPEGSITIRSKSAPTGRQLTE